MMGGYIFTCMARFILDDLLKKDKVELERIKTAVDIYQSEDKHAFERKKFKTENFRFFGIAILTAVISLGSSYLIESFRQKNTTSENVKKEFVELKKTFLTEKDKSKQNELACALASFDNSVKDKAITNAQINFQTICNSLSKIQEQAQTISNTDTSSEVVKDALNKLNNFDKKLHDLTEQKKSATPLEQKKIVQQITQVNDEIKTVVNTVPEIKTAVNSSEKIEQNVTRIEKVNDNILQQQPESDKISKSHIAWFKEGYFLRFGEYRILLQYLDKSLGIQVEVCKDPGTGKCENPLLTKAWVKFDSPLQFSDNGHIYRINLEAIDHAGKNPFKLAAYITFETVNRK
ncbi:MAG: hypothetical protein JWO92_680 [Chitinophagaceae bacterium]|nr:hypothetical protein [Chitinophagaceae bacterium]MDB5222387.1 hypothetical protein [Chitinophagaceae bacterium]